MTGTFLLSRGLGTGTLRERCAFERPETVTTPGGGSVVEFVAEGELFGRIEPLGAPSETDASGRRETVVRAVLTVRDNARSQRIDGTWRVRVQGAIWNIVGRYPLEQVRGMLRFQIEAGVGS